ncbi:hypothetical protein HDV00_010013 [Rhizophlyctis rosea]|nr:hypothetical protein HDV00_010013 [Rhizophlyctis rosea]
MKALANASSLPTDDFGLMPPTHNLLETLEAFSKAPSKLGSSKLTSVPMLVLGFWRTRGDGVVPGGILDGLRDEYVERLGCLPNVLDSTAYDKEPSHLAMLEIGASVQLVNSVVEWMDKQGL